MMKKILVTGATGFVGKNLVPYLKKKGYKVRVFVRDKKRCKIKGVDIFEGDLIRKEDALKALKNIDIAYFLVHGMSQTSKFEKLEKIYARNFSIACSKNNVKRIIYLGGIIDSQTLLSTHLQSRKVVGDILRKSKTKVTELRASIIIGKGSISFEIIKKIVEKFPLIFFSKDINSLCQPIALKDVLYYLEGCVRKRETIGKIFDIGGKDILEYKDLLLLYGEVIGKKIVILPLPFFSPKLYSYLISLIKRQPLNLVQALIEGLQSNTVCQENRILEILPKEPLSYKMAIKTEIFN